MTAAELKRAAAEVLAAYDGCYPSPVETQMLTILRAVANGDVCHCDTVLADGRSPLLEAVGKRGYYQGRDVLVIGGEDVPSP
jgi:hypothetical protein